MGTAIRFLSFLHRLVQMGETGGFFGRVAQAGWHQRSIRMVCDGEVDASAIDAQVLAVELRDHPELGSRLKILGPLARPQSSRW